MLKRFQILFPLSVCLVLSGSLPVAGQDSLPELTKAKEALNSGGYDEARALFRSLLEDSSVDQGEKVLGYFETFLAKGEYNEGMAELDAHLEESPDDPFLFHMKGRFLTEKGQYQEAETAFVRAGMSRPGFSRNFLELGDLMQITGRKDEASGFYRQIAAEYLRGGLRTAEAIGIAGQAFARLEDFHEANQVFRRAYEIDPRNIQNLTWWGDLFLEKYNNADAQRTLEEALSINQHSADLYVGYANSLESLTQKESLANKALEENPNCVDALNILAQVQILDARYDEAKEILVRALEVNPSYEQSLANLATVYHLRNERESYNQTELKILGINPASSDFYTTLAENCIGRFRYQDAVDFCYKAISNDWRNWHAYGLLGANLLRIGKVDEARRFLERGFRGDPFNLFARNTLELIDEYENFDTLQSEHFELLIHNSESAVLGQPILALAEECYDSLSTRYPYRPVAKIKIEAYNDHDDFAVRISGLPGISLLGVCFGDVLAIDTPKSQPHNEYNWARTLWHELAHVMAIGISDHRVPRWYTEGLSVYEEMLARPEWRRKMDLELFAALDQDLLLPIEDINQGFTRPKFPEQIMLTYYQSAKWMEFIAERYGFNAITEMLVEFGKGQDLESAFQTVLNQTPKDVEELLLDVLKSERDQYGAVLSNLPPMFGIQKDEQSFSEKLLGKSANPFFENLKKGFELLKDGDLDEAEAKFLKAIEIYPSFTHGGNAYQGLAKIYRERGEKAKLRDILKRYLSITEYGAEEARELAKIYEGEGNPALSEYYFERSMQVEPYDLNTHMRLAELYKAQEDFSSEIDARRAILALNPLDESNAHFQLALSLYNRGRKLDAKREVLKSLEIAPGFREAQKLLLKCVEVQD